MSFDVSFKGNLAHNSMILLFRVNFISNRELIAEKI